MTDLDRDTGELLEPIAAAWALSPTIANLAASLAKAQGQMRSAEFDRTNPHFGQKYMSLASLWATIRAPLSNNGLSIVQLVSADGLLISIETILLHESGECVRSTLSLTARDITPQAVGSLVTYMKRYSISAVTGVVGDQDDDDAEAATGRLGPMPPATTAAKPKPAKAEKPGKPEKATKGEPTISDEQRARMFAIAAAAGWQRDEIKGFLKAQYGLASTKDITQAKYDAIVSALHAGPAPGPASGDAEVF